MWVGVVLVHTYTYRHAYTRISFAAKLMLSGIIEINCHQSEDLWVKVYRFENIAITTFPLNRPLCKDIIPLQRLTKEWLESIYVLNLVKQVYKPAFVGELVVITLQLKVACRLKAQLRNLKHIYSLPAAKPLSL